MENQKSNDLFYVCSLIECIARKTNNKRCDVVNRMGEKMIRHLYDLADIYHSEDIRNVADDCIQKANITKGKFDNVGMCLYSVPSCWDIGKVYKRLILMACESGKDPITTLISVYNSKTSEKIDDYNSAFYYDSPANIFSYYLQPTVA